MPELDHLILASPNVEEGVDLVEQLTGVRPVPGGQHPGGGTHNYLLTFDERTYFEIIGIDPDQPDPGRERPFGLDDRDGPGLAGYAIHPTGDETLEDVVATMRAAGFDPGTISDMSRKKPDGSVLAWRLTLGGQSGPASQGALPFAIDWADGTSPAGSLPSMGRLLSLTITHPDEAIVAAASALDVGVTAEVGDARLALTVETANGPVTIS